MSFSAHPRANRMLVAAVVAAALVLGTSAPASAELVNATTPVGTGVVVSATVGGTQVTLRFATVASEGLAYFESVPSDQAETAGAPEEIGEFIFNVGSFASWSGQHDVCFSFDPSDFSETPSVYASEWNEALQQDEWVEITTTSWVPGAVCGTPDLGNLSGTYVLGVTEPAPPTPQALPVDTADFEISMDAAFGDPYELGEGQYFELRLANTSAEPLRLGLGADLEVEGLPERLWFPGAWAGGTSGLEEIFSHELQPGEVFELPVPDWPGKTYYFYQLDDVTDTGDLVGFHTASGGFVSFRASTDLTIGSEASVAGASGQAELFPGVEATATAAGLVPGEVHELWLAPGLDYFAFVALGATLPLDAVQVGTGIVAADGTLSAAFEVPANTALGGYQLVVGDPGNRYWPAGSYESFQVGLPASAISAATPTGAAEVDLTVGSTLVELAFASVISSGVTTVAASTTGPAPGGFAVTTTPQLYYHLSTTATFSGLVEVCITYDPALVTGGVPWLYHYTSPAWQNVTTSRAVGRVCGMTDSFSPFTLGYSGVPDVVLINRDQCKKGGWEASTLPVFKNQGACVSHFAGAKKAS